MIKTADFPLPISPELSICVLESRDANELFVLVDANREHLSRWLPWVELTRSSDDTASFITRAQQQLSGQTGVHCAIRRGDRTIGVIGIHAYNAMHHWAQLGYWLAADACGQGVMTQAVARMLQYCYEQLECHRVEIAAAIENSASRAVAERLGFTYEGVRRGCELLDASYVDHAVYSLLRSEWHEQPTSSE